MKQKEIKLQLNGKEYVFPFGLGFLGECLENLGLNVFEIGEKLDSNPFKWIPTLMYESYKYECLLNGTKAEFTYRELINWLDNDEGQKVMNTFLLSFIDSLKKDVPQEESAKSGKVAKKK